ncbi:MAG: phosphoglucosamine mutase [Candidatus Bathyarchaeota archaeon]|nr:MAG: phosphoglucosamine mutase [Candidatus Bathyarchaeota archaeon]
MFGTNGIRGVVNRDFKPEFTTKVAEAIGTFFEQSEIIIGCDGRSSNVMLKSGVTSGLVATGCSVYDAGLAPTPCIQYAARSHRFGGGVMITASHNPAEYNGIKVLGKDGVEVSRREEIKIENTFFRNKADRVEWQKVGRRSILDGVLEDYMDAIIGHVRVNDIRKRRFHVVLDSANGVASLVSPRMLRELGCRVTSLNADLSGEFPGRTPEPRPENLSDLRKTVRMTGAHFGVAFDGDADRTIFVDETGEVQWGDRTFALIEDHFLAGNPGEKVVTPVSSSQVVRDVAEKHESNVIWTKVGSTIVSHTMKKTRTKLGGEENGGVFYGPHQPVRDGAMTIALILEIMARSNRKLSKLLNDLPRYYIKKGKIHCPNAQKDLVLERLNDSVKQLEPETVDGVKLWFSDGSSILIRPSGTEPVYRFYAEARTIEKASRLITLYKRKLQAFVGSTRSESKEPEETTIENLPM